MNLVLHIGIAEAAAGLIQASLSHNAIWLSEQGCAYADLLTPTTNHVTLYFACAAAPNRLTQDFGLHTKDDLKALRDQLDQHIEKQAHGSDHTHTLLMSSAALSGLMRREDEIAALRALLAPHFETIKILVYVRRQDDALLQKYNELIRRGQSGETFSSFVETCLGPADPIPHLDYRRSLLPWVKIWGPETLVVRRYSAADFIYGDLMADVMGVVQDTWEPDLNGFSSVPDPTRSLSAASLEFLRLIHSTIPFQKNGHPNAQRKALLPALNALPEHPRPIMPVALSNQIMGHYRAVNNWLSSQFTPDTTTAFFPDRLDHPTHGNLGQLSGNDACSMAARLIERLAHD